MADIVEYVTDVKWKLAGHTARMKDNSWTIVSAGWQTKGVTSVGRPNVVGETKLGALGKGMDKDRESWRTLAEGYFLQWKNTA